MENTQKNIEKNLQSSKKHSYNLHSPGVRTYKDSVFCRIFNEKKELLRAKLMEEVNEYLEDDNLEELADVMEVLFGLANQLGYTEEDLIKKR